MTMHRNKKVLKQGRTEAIGIGSGDPLCSPSGVHCGNCFYVRRTLHGLMR